MYKTPEYIPNHELADLGFKLQHSLENAMQHEFGWLLTGMKHRVTHHDPNFRMETQDRVDAAVQGILLVYLFAIFDEYTTDELRGNWISENDKYVLKAYRHLRNSIAHGHGGKRAPNCKSRDQFEIVMNSDKPFPNLVWDRTQDTIDMTKSQVAHDCYNHMSNITRKMIGHLINNIRP